MKQRNARYEFIRTIAMVMVIGAHAQANIPTDTLNGKVLYHTVVTLVFLCNGLFFMLSGKFALACVCETWEDYKKYYLKKLIGLGVPILVYMLIRTFYEAGWTFPVITVTKRYIFNVLGDLASTEFWFLYSLFGMLLAAPVLGKFFQRAGSKELWLIFGLGFAHNALRIYASALGLPFEWHFVLSGDLFYFLLGFGLERLITSRKQENVIYLLGAVSLAVTTVQKCIGPFSGAHLGAPAYTFLLCAAFLGLKRLYRPGKVANRVVIWLGKYSMSVYMVHVIVLNGLVERIRLDNYWAQIAVLMLLTTVISLAVGFVIDNLIVHPIQRGLFKLAGSGREK